MAYSTNNNCVFCRNGCLKHCPVGAIYFDGDRNVIDQSKCIQCGLCSRICNMGAIQESGAQPAPVHTPSEAEYTCDFLVVGGGGAGLVAALKAKELSGKRVIVLEKMSKPGGCAFYASGFHVYESQWQKQAGARPVIDELVRAAFNTTKGLISTEFILNAYRADTDFFDWFCQWGSPEKQFTLSSDSSAWDHLEDGVQLVTGPTFDQPMLVNLEPDSAGKYIMNQCVKRCQELGVEVFTNCAAKEFILESGRVTGVIAQGPAGQITIHCKACLMATGNLSGDPDMVARFYPQCNDMFLRRSAHAYPGCTGDAIKMAEQAGLPVDYQGICGGFLGSMAVPFHPELLAQNRRGEVLKVNAEGKRWENESVRGEGCNFTLMQQPQCVSWIVMDSEILNMEPLPQLPVLFDTNYGRRMFLAINRNDGTPNPYAGTVRLGPAPPNFGTDQRNNEKKDGLMQHFATLKGKHVVWANTLEELADQMDIPRQTLLETVARYNQLCAKGHDDDFLKPATHMIPIQSGPFYAIHNHLAHDGIFGGFAVNQNTQVIDANGVPVPGLYAAGDNTSSRYINCGGDKREIMSDLTWAFSSGYIAGCQVAAQLLAQDGQ